MAHGDSLNACVGDGPGKSSENRKDNSDKGNSNNIKSEEKSNSGKGNSNNIKGEEKSNSGKGNNNDDNENDDEDD